MIDSVESIDIRVGTADDREAIIEFALALSEDPFSSRDKWEELVRDDQTFPLLAVYRQNVVGKVQSKIVRGMGWIESAQVSPDFRKQGIANTLVDAGIDWLISKGIDRIRTVVDSDNTSARRILERNHFSPKFLSINPNTRVNETDGEPNHTADFAAVLDEDFYPEYLEPVQSQFSGNVMIDGYYVPFTPDLFKDLIDQRRIYTTQDRSIMLILSKHNLPSEYWGLIVSKEPDGYTKAGQALRGFASREMATLVVAHAPSRREAVIGLAKAEYGWSQPHSLIIYERDSWQERSN